MDIGVHCDSHVPTENVSFVATTHREDVPQEPLVVMVDGTVPGWQKKPGDFHFDHHRPDGDAIQLTEISPEDARAIQQRLEYTPTCFVTTLADADAAAAAAYCLTSATGENRQKLCAIAYECDHLHVPDSLNQYADFAFNAVATFKLNGDRLREKLGLDRNRKSWSQEQRLEFSSQLFAVATKQYVDAIRGEKAWPGERGEADHYRASIEAMAKRLLMEKRTYFLDGIAVADCRGIDDYVDPRSTQLAWLTINQSPTRPETLTVHDHTKGGVSYTLGSLPQHPLQLEMDYCIDTYPTLSALEIKQGNTFPDWGGRRAVGGSPWNSGSLLTPQQVVSVLLAMARK